MVVSSSCTLKLTSITLNGASKNTWIRADDCCNLPADPTDWYLVTVRLLNGKDFPAFLGVIVTVGCLTFLRFLTEQKCHCLNSELIAATSATTSQKTQENLTRKSWRDGKRVTSKDKLYCKILILIGTEHLEHSSKTTTRCRYHWSCVGAGGTWKLSYSLEETNLRNSSDHAAKQAHVSCTQEIWISSCSGTFQNLIRHHKLQSWNCKSNISGMDSISGRRQRSSWLSFCATWHCIHPLEWKTPVFSHFTWLRLGYHLNWQTQANTPAKHPALAKKCLHKSHHGN